MRALFGILFIVSACFLQAQTGTVFGTVRSEGGTALPFASVSVDGTEFRATAKENGSYEITVPSGREVVIRFGYSGAPTITRAVQLVANQREQLDIAMKATELPATQVTPNRLRDASITKMDAKVTRFIPSPLGDVNSLLIGQAGVSTRNELSSGYSVRAVSYTHLTLPTSDLV